MNAFYEYWRPSTKFGFLPPSTSTICSGTSGDFKWFESIQTSFSTLSDEDIWDVALNCEKVEPDQLSSLGVEDSELLLRFYSVLACRIIHRRGFDGRRILPSKVAVPLWFLAKRVSRPPALTYASYVLSNFIEFPGVNSPTSAFKIHCTPTGTSDEEWFVAAHLAVESSGGAAVEAILGIEESLAEEDWQRTSEALHSIADAMRHAKQVLWTIPERLDPNVFRTRIRPYLYGYENVEFEGVPELAKFSYVGETGAQSGMIRAVDAILAPSHSEKTLRPMREFLVCAPPAHRDFIQRATDLGVQLLEKQAKSKLVQVARTEALFEIADFRRIHLEIVSRFLVQDGKHLSERGTGGTELKTWLQEVLDDTNATLDSNAKCPFSHASWGAN